MEVSVGVGGGGHLFDRCLGHDTVGAALAHNMAENDVVMR